MITNSDKIYKLEESFVLEVTGLHAERYLHNRSTQDIKSIPIPGVLPACILSAQGRLEGVFTVIRLAKNHFLLAVRSGNQEEFLSRLLQFKVAEDLAVSVSDRFINFFWRGETASSIPFDGQPLATAGPQSRIYKSTNGFSWPLLDGHECLLDKNFFDSIPPAELGELSRQDFDLARIKGRLPLYDHEINVNTFIMDLPFISHIAFGAGCYVGQEVVEKTDARGKAPKKLVAIKLNSANIPPVNAEVLAVSGSEKIKKGKVLLSALDAAEDQAWCLAMVKNEPLALVTVGDSSGEVVE